MMTTNYDDWREVPDTGGRYLCNKLGEVKDTSPKTKYIDSEFQIESENDQWRYVPLSSDGWYRGIKLEDGSLKSFKPERLMLELFPELYFIGKNRLKEIANSIKVCGQFTYDVEEFNRIIFPNRLIQLYDKGTKREWNYNKDYTFGWWAPKKVPVINGKFTLRNDHLYVGIGERNIIGVDKSFPFNSYAWWVSNKSSQEGLN